MTEATRRRNEKERQGRRSEDTWDKGKRLRPAKSGAQASSKEQVQVAEIAAFDVLRWRCLACRGAVVAFGLVPIIKHGSPPFVREGMDTRVAAFSVPRWLGLLGSRVLNLLLYEC